MVAPTMLAARSAHSGPHNSIIGRPGVRPSETRTPAAKTDNPQDSLVLQSDPCRHGRHRR
jgi:hypothetical protein